jgi:hypothetical protein
MVPPLYSARRDALAGETTLVSEHLKKLKRLLSGAPPAPEKKPAPELPPEYKLRPERAPEGERELTRIFRKK